eukprot:m.69807 g.69807  ORF g.69807 m.69807 type:complete len:386 (-) comp24145_c0_seq1:240-1397(-)
MSNAKSPALLVGKCGSCGVPDGKKRCGGCFSVFYCSAECQKKHWGDGHKKECKILKAKKAMLDSSANRVDSPARAPTKPASKQGESAISVKTTSKTVATSPTPTTTVVTASNQETMEKLVQSKIEEANELWKKKDLNAALKAFQDTRSFCSQVFGDAYQQTIWTGDMVANIHAERKDFMNAEVAHRRQLALKLKLFGADHPIVLLNTLQPLSDILLQLGKVSEAADVLTQLMESCKRTYGLKSPHTGCAASNLGLALDGLQRYDEAVKVGKEALDICILVWGPTGINTLKTKCNLARALFGNDEPEEAATIGTDALETCIEVLGEDHPLTKKTEAELEIVESMLEQTTGGYTEEEMDKMFSESANEKPSLFQQLNDAIYPYCSIM